jgi:hypothetical protein
MITHLTLFVQKRVPLPPHLAVDEMGQRHLHLTEKRLVAAGVLIDTFWFCVQS